MTSRERVMATLNFQSTDRVPCDLAGMRSTGISCFAYPNLVAALGLPPRRPKVYDTGQMQVREVVPVLASGGGYVFCNIHNILAEIAPEKVMAMYRTAKATSRGVVGLPQGCVVR